MVPAVCKSPAGTEADGVKVICEEETEYPAVKVVPPIFITGVPVAAYQPLSVYVTLKAASTVAEPAA